MILPSSSVKAPTFVLSVLALSGFISAHPAQDSHTNHAIKRVSNKFQRDDKPRTHTTILYVDDQFYGYYQTITSKEGECVTLDNELNNNYSSMKFKRVVIVTFTMRMIVLH
jgi:hypothetical protein